MSIIVKLLNRLLGCQMRGACRYRQRKMGVYVTQLRCRLCGWQGQSESPSPLQEEQICYVSETKIKPKLRRTAPRAGRRL